MAINSWDRCERCGHWAGDSDVPFRIYTERRAAWLEEAAKQLKKIDGDDDWVEWREEGRRLKAAKE